MTKKKNKRIIYLLLIVILLLALLSFRFCGAEVEEPLDDGSKPAVALLEKKILKRTDDQIHFTLHFAVLKDSKHAEEALKSADVLIDSLKSPWIVFEQEEFDKVSLNKKESFTAVLLIDQSGSMSSNDRNNQRIAAARKFNENFGQENYLMLWAFGGKGGKFRSYGEDFAKDTTFFEKSIEELELVNPTGGSPLFKAQDSILKYLDIYAPTKIKALVSLTDGAASGRADYHSAVATSLEKGISLFNIGLVSDPKILREQALETQGAYVHAGETEQLLSVFGNLGSLIQGTSTVYQTEWSAHRRKGKFGKRGRIRHEMTILLPYGDTIRLPFEVEW